MISFKEIFQTVKTKRYLLILCSSLQNQLVKTAWEPSIIFLSVEAECTIIEQIKGLRVEG